MSDVARTTARAPVDFVCVDERHADVWPLKPEGDLLAIVMIQVACAITASTAADVVMRVRQGGTIIRSTVPAIEGGRAWLAGR